MSPVFQNVSPGDLITADYFNQLLNEVNWLVDAVTQLNARVTALEAAEAAEGSPPKGKETKEGKEGKEGKELTKDKLESKEHKEIVKEIEKSAVVEKGVLEKSAATEKGVEKVVEKAIEKVTEKGLEKQFERKLSEVKVTDASADLRSAANGAPAGVGTTADDPTVRHFIPAELRPDLTTSALREEPDLAGTDSGGAASVPADSGAATRAGAEPVTVGPTQGGTG